MAQERRATSPVHFPVLMAGHSRSQYRHSQRSIATLQVLERFLHHLFFKIVLSRGKCESLPRAPPHLNIVHAAPRGHAPDGKVFAPLLRPQSIVFLFSPSR